MAVKKIKELLRQDSTYLIIFIFISVVVLAAKIYVVMNQSPKIFYDSYDYYHYGEEILKGNIASPEAKRLPGYPLFIAAAYILFGYTMSAIVWLQIVTGFLTVYLFYKLQLLLGLSQKVTYINLSLFMLSPMSYMELDILSESLAVFAAALYLYLLVRHLKEGKYLLFVVVSSLILCGIRPQFIIPVIVSSFYFLYKGRRTLAYSLLLPVLLFSLLYSYINLRSNEYFGLSSMLGYNLINHTGGFIEDAYYQNPQLVKIYLSAREEYLKDHPEPYFVIWKCNKEIMQKLGYSHTELSSELVHISLYLIGKHPYKYLQSLTTGIYRSLVYTNNYIHEGYKAKFPSFISLIIIITGTLFLIAVPTSSVEFNYLKLFYFSSWISALMLDIGENFRHILPLMFILFISFTSIIPLIIKKITFEKAVSDTV